jgi:hypothetical protein
MGAYNSTETRPGGLDGPEGDGEGSNRDEFDAAMPSALVICGPSGVGKGTLIKRLMADSAKFGFSCSHTTRSPRPGETVGLPYQHLCTPSSAHFLSENNMETQYHQQLGSQAYTLKSRTCRRMARSTTSQTGRPSRVVSARANSWSMLRFTTTSTARRIRRWRWWGSPAAAACLI